MAENSYQQEGRVATNNSNMVVESNNSSTELEVTSIGVPMLEGGIEENEIPYYSNNLESLFTLDISQGSFFTLEIEGLMLDGNINHHVIGRPNNINAEGFGKFLPIKSLDYSPVSMENKQIDAGIFRDLFLIEKKKMGLLNIVLLDTSDNKYEKAITDWFNLPGNDGYRGGYIGYLVDWAKVCRYNEFTVRGELSKSYEFMVLPTGDVKTNRAYDNNQLKEISFTVVIGSDITILRNNGKK